MAFGKGDHVSWNTSQGETHGSVVEKRTSDFTFEGQQFRPTQDDPFYIVAPGPPTRSRPCASAAEPPAGHR